MNTEIQQDTILTHFPSDEKEDRNINTNEEKIITDENITDEKTCQDLQDSILPHLPSNYEEEINNELEEQFYKQLDSLFKKRSDKIVTHEEYSVIHEEYKKHKNNEAYQELFRTFKTVLKNVFTTDGSFVPGQFEYVEDENMRDLLVTTWQAINMTDSWLFVFKFNEKDFLSWSHAQIGTIHDKIDELYWDHNSMTYDYASNSIHLIVQNGEIEFKKNYKNLTREEINEMSLGTRLKYL